MNTVPFIDPDNNFIDITISGGIATYRGQDIAQFIAEADRSLYKAKRTGRNKIV